MGRTAFVTGATGFIGSHLCEALCARGFEVTAAALPGASAPWLANLSLRYVEVDLVHPQGLTGLLHGADYVFHVAGVTRAHGKRAYHVGNQMTTRHLLRAAVEGGAGSRRFVYVSSLSAAGPASPGRPAVETDPAFPITYYGTSKLAAEGEVLAHRRVLPVAIVRPPAVYGPRDRNMIDVFKSAAKGFAFLPNGGRAPVSLVYVTDLVQGLLLAAERPEARGQVYYISGTTTTTRGVCRALEGVLGRPIRYINVPPLFLKCAGELGEVKWLVTGKPQIICRRKIKDLLKPSWAASGEKARRDLGYRPRVGLRAGLKATLDWYREQGWI